MEFGSKNLMLVAVNQLESGYILCLKKHRFYSIMQANEKVGGLDITLSSFSAG